MHTFSETGAGVPAFLAKLWRLVEDPETNHLIYWNKDGRSFIIQNQAQFSRELLPLNYKHNNMASFIRQLNMYGFHKITSIDNGGLKFDRDEMEFSHPCFKRGHPFLLDHIKRKIATTKSTIDEKGLMKPEAVNKVLSEVKAMRGRQDSLDSRFSVMKQENEALWREIASLRQKHMKQQQIVNKLIQFLVTMVQPSRSNVGGVKRHFQLMINDAPQSSKLRKKNESNNGPVIRELTEELLDEVADSNVELMISSPSILSPPDLAEDPVGSSSANYDRPRSNSSLLLNNHNFDSNQSIDDDAVEEATQKSVGENEDFVFHISEIPENTELEANQHTEENVLNTPMVKKEIARAQKEKQIKHLRKPKGKEQKLAKYGISSEKKNNSMNFTTNNSKTNRNGNNTLKKQNDNATILCTNDGSNLIKIKTEKDIDSLLLEYSNDVSSNNNNDPTLMPSINPRVLLNVNMQNQQNDSEIGVNDTNKELYGEFVTSDLFENSSMIDEINLTQETYNQDVNNDCNLIASQGDSNVTENNDGTNKKAVTIEVALPSTSKTTIDKSQNQNTTLAKYNTSKLDDDIMRLSTAEEYATHLDGVQDDLDNIKDLLRSDGYSLDSNTLLGNTTSPNRFVLSSPLDGDILSKLFNDSDILSYGLTISNENADDSKKGSELMSYQPYFADFSDILYSNADAIPKSPNPSYNESGKSNKLTSSSNSVLNTPYRE